MDDRPLDDHHTFPENLGHPARCRRKLPSRASVSQPPWHYEKLTLPIVIDDSDGGHKVATGRAGKVSP